MEYLHKCFNKSTGWNTDNIFDNILATSDALLDFQVPNGGRLEISSQATPYLASSVTLSNRLAVTGLLAYLYLSVPIKNAIGTKDILLQDAIAGFRIIRPNLLPESGSRSSKVSPKGSLMYGKMFFPGSALEAMFIRRISPNLQLLVKCINNAHIYKSGTMIVYLQENTPRFSREYIYSTNEALIGFRCLYNFGEQTGLPATPVIPKFDNSVVSVGAELWYAAQSMSPGLSTALRYSTRSTSTGKPLTMTLSCNPILGHISLTYNVKTSVSSTVCSKYDFNWFLYASNLSMGVELYNFSKKSPFFSSTQNRSLTSIHYDTLAPTADPETLAHSVTNNAQSFPTTNNTVALSESIFLRPGSSRISDINSQEVVNAFQNLVKESNFSSVLKASTSLNDRMVKILWVGRYKDFLVSTGVKLQFDSATAVPDVGRFGVSLAYGC